MKRTELIKILKSAKRHRNPDITFWIDDDIKLEVDDVGEFEIMPELTVHLKVVGKLFSKDSPKTIKSKLKSKIKK